MAARPTAEETENTSGDIRLVLEAARDAIRQEFQIAERLDAKARNQMAIAGTWFAVVQGVAGLAIGDDETGSFFGWSYVTIIVVLAGAAGACLIVAMTLSYLVWRLRDEEEITHKALFEMADVARNPSDGLEDKLVAHNARILVRAAPTTSSEHGTSVDLSSGGSACSHSRLSSSSHRSPRSDNSDGGRSQRARAGLGFRRRRRRTTDFRRRRNLGSAARESVCNRDSGVHGGAR